MFDRRIHADASSQNRDPDWQSVFFKGRRGRIELPNWHVYVDHCRTILASDLSSRDKLACLGIVAARMKTGRRELLREACSAGRYWFRMNIPHWN